jgi:hypothetical protein
VVTNDTAFCCCFCPDVLDSVPLVPIKKSGFTNRDSSRLLHCSI